MRITKAVILATVATCTIASTRGESVAATGPNVYALSSPNHYLECLVLTEIGDRVGGYYEMDRKSDDSATGVKHKQITISQQLVGNVFTFDNYTASRTSDGFTLTSIADDGQVSEHRLSRTNTAWVYASLRKLAVNGRQAPALSELKATTADVHQRAAAEQSPTVLLTEAQQRLDDAVATARDLQTKADSLWQVANDLRAGADAQIESPGVSFERNDALKYAMELADEAERKARYAQRLATLAVGTVTASQGDVKATRNRIAARQKPGQTLTDLPSADDLDR